MRWSCLRWVPFYLLASTWAGAATVELVKDVGDKDILAGSSPVFFGAVGNRGYFAATPFNGTAKLYRTDGTTASTVPVVTSQTLTRPTDGLEINGRVVFLAHGNSDHVTELWSTDGTDGGTTRLATTNNVSAHIYWLASDRATRGYLCYSTFGSCELYATNGTAAGTERLVTNRSVNPASASLMAGGKLYFTSAPLGTFNEELWVSDGTAAGTRAVIAVSATTLSALSQTLYVEGNSALVLGSDAQGSGVFSLNLTSGTATRLVAAQVVSDRGVHVGALHFFIKDYNLWRTDGTAAGTFVLTDASTFAGVEGPLRVLGDRVVFNHQSVTEGREAWVTDGTLAGTVMLRETAPGPGGMSRIVAATSTHVYFVAGEQNSASPVRFWISDGTPGGTALVPLGGSTTYDLPVDGTPSGVIAGDRVFFMARDVAQLPIGYVFYNRLFSSDLAGGSAVEVGSAADVAVAVGNSVMFANVLDPSGTEPWFSDGTPSGTARLLDVALSGQTNDSDPKDFTVFGNRALFVADDGASGRELWVTDGSNAGTTLVKDIAPGPASSTPSGLRIESGLAYFVAGNGSVSDGGGGRLWRSDGSAAGTIPLGDTRAFVGGGASGGCGNWSASWNGRVWFFGQAEIPQGNELWSTDGTEAGTHREFLMPSSVRSVALCELHATANGLIFIKDTYPTTELWRSDGTLAGTTRILDIRPAGVTSGPASMAAGIVVVNGVAYLLADGGAGPEPWRSDGTAAGTAQVEDLTSGVRGAQNYSATRFGAGIIFSYSSEPGDANGLWRITSATSGASRIKSGRITRGPIAAGSRTFFQFYDSAGTESLWSTDGTSAGTRMGFSASAGGLLGIADLLGGDGVLFFSGSPNGSSTTNQLWVTNGAPGGERSLGSLPGTAVFPSRAVLLNAVPLLAATDATHGTEPWRVRNAAPVAVADSASVTGGSSVLVNVRSNDADADSASADLEVTLVSTAAHGTAVVQNNQVRYTPAAGFTGIDTFDYRLTDELGAQSAANTVTVTVSAAPSGGGGGSGNGGGGGGLDLILLAALTAASYRRWWQVHSRR